MNMFRWALAKVYWALIGLGRPRARYLASRIIAFRIKVGV